MFTIIMIWLIGTVEIRLAEYDIETRKAVRRKLITYLLIGYGVLVAIISIFND